MNDSGYDFVVFRLLFISLVDQQIELAYFRGLFIFDLPVQKKYLVYHFTKFLFDHLGQRFI